MMDAFAPLDGVSTVSLSATTVTSRVQFAGMPRTGSFQIRVKNGGAAAASIKLGGAAVAAALTDMEVLSGGTEVFTVNNRDGNIIDYLAAITASGTADLDITTGQGL